MKKKFYISEKIKVMLIAFIGMLVSVSVVAQEYTDTTGLVEDIEAGLYEEYILAPASVEDTFNIKKQIDVPGSAIIRAKEGLGFKPVVTGQYDEPNYLFYFGKDLVGGADFELQGLHFVGEVNGKKYIDDGTVKVETENINITVTDCEFHDFDSYNAIAKVYNSGGDITVDNVLVHNCGGKIIQINYKDDDNTPNYVPHMGDLTVTNSTFSKIYKRIWFELGAGDVIVQEDPEVKERFNAGVDNIIIDHCTFYGFEGVDVMQGREFYAFNGDQSAVKGQLSITNTIFAKMGENLNADSASQTIFDSNYLDFGYDFETPEEDLEDFTKYGPTNTIETDPVFADEDNYDLTLQNEADILGNDGTPIGDPRWWQEEWIPIGVKNAKANAVVAKVYSYGNNVVINADEYQDANATVFNITGQLIQTMNLRSDRTEFQLPSGLYIIRVSSPKGSVAGKVLIGK